jgi:hypothetical protein
VNDTLKKYYNPMRDVWGQPQIYKKIPFYPIKLYQQKQYKMVSTLFSVYNKQISNKTLARMSFLKFLMLIVGESPSFEGTSIEYEMKKLLKFITHQKNVEYFLNIEDPSNYDTYRMYFTINGIKLNETDFENIQELVLTQNHINFEHIKQYNPELEDALIFINQGQNSSTFEDQIFSFSAVMKIPIELLRKGYTIYQFQKTLERLRLVKEYDVFKGLETAGLISMKCGKIADWLSTLPDRGRYDSILISKETFVKDNDIFKVSASK